MGRRLTYDLQYELLKDRLAKLNAPPSDNSSLISQLDNFNNSSIIKSEQKNLILEKIYQKHTQILF